MPHIHHIQWLFHLSLSIQLMVVLTCLNIKNIEAFQTIIGNVLIFTYTYLITSDFKFSIFFNIFGYFISLI